MITREKQEPRGPIGEDFRNAKKEQGVEVVKTRAGRQQQSLGPRIQSCYAQARKSFDFSAVEWVRIKNIPDMMFPARQSDA